MGTVPNFPRISFVSNIFKKVVEIKKWYDTIKTIFYYKLKKEENQSERNKRREKTYGWRENLFN